jgi:diguanylate cyclase (GGDEF)-like protein
LPAADRDSTTARFRPLLAELEVESTDIAQGTQAEIDEHTREELLGHSSNQTRGAVLFILATALGLLLGLVSLLRIRNGYRRARDQIAADRTALDRAGALERGEADILAGVVRGEAAAALLVDVLDLADTMSGCTFRLALADHLQLSGVERVIDPRGADDQGTCAAVASWPVGVDVASDLGTLQLMVAGGGPQPEVDDELDRLARRTADHAALVIDRVLAAERLEHRATHDSLTGMPNRSMVLDQIASALVERDSVGGEPPVVVFCDLDRFKLVNDTLGHRSGDRLLRAVARRLESCVRDQDVTIARLGGDEFVALCRGASARRAATRLADSIAAALDPPFVIDGSEVFVAASIGIAHADESVASAEQLLRNADVAMYQAKRDPQLYAVVYDDTLEDELAERLSTDAALRRALNSEGIVVHLQPIFDVDADGGARGVEALVRWERDGALIPPVAFLELAERNGLMPQLGREVIRQSLDVFAAHRRKLGADFSLWINIALVQLRDPAFPAWLAEQLDRAGVPATEVVLELSEGDILEIGEVGASLDALRSSGIRIAMDDFGTGYSSLVRLHALPIDVVKLDRAFIAALADGGERAQSVLEAAVQLADAVGLDMVVEGIETTEELETIRSLGCRFAQGYLLCRPGPADDVLAGLVGAMPVELTGVGSSPPPAG